MRKVLAVFALSTCTAFAQADEYRYEPAPGDRVWVWDGQKLLGCSIGGRFFTRDTDGNMVEAPMPCCQGKDDPKQPDVKKPDKQPPVKYHRGYKLPAADVLLKRHVEAAARHNSKVARLPQATPATFNCVALGWTLPVDDQAQCGSCWAVSTCGAWSDAYAKAGAWPNDGSMHIAAQCVMDQCFGSNGGCNGGDGAGDILGPISAKGLPTEKDYGPYTANSGQCKYTNQKLYPLANWGYCTPNQQQGIAATQDIKNTMAQYGSILTCVGADSSWDNIGSDGILPFVRPDPSGNTINHEVRLVAWDDTKQIPGAPTPGAWLCQNQWGKAWGLNGFCWIAYTSHSIGFESTWQIAPSTPTPPTPTQPTANIAANPTSIAAGGTSTLTWSSTNGVSATLNGQAVPLSGTQVVNPAATTAYTLVVTGAAGTLPATAAAAVTVGNGPTPPVTGSYYTMSTDPNGVITFTPAPPGSVVLSPATVQALLLDFQKAAKQAKQK